MLTKKIAPQRHKIGSTLTLNVLVNNVKLPVKATSYNPEGSILYIQISGKIKKPKQGKYEDKTGDCYLSVIK